MRPLPRRAAATRRARAAPPAAAARRRRPRPRPPRRARGCPRRGRAHARTRGRAGPAPASGRGWPSGDGGRTARATVAARAAAAPSWCSRTYGRSPVGGPQAPAVLAEHDREARDHALQVGGRPGAPAARSPRPRAAASRRRSDPRRRDQQERRALRVRHPARLVEREVAGHDGRAGGEQAAIRAAQRRQRAAVAAAREQPRGHAVERPRRPEQRERPRLRPPRVVPDQGGRGRAPAGPWANPTETHGDHPCEGSGRGGPRADTGPGTVPLPACDRKTTS